MNLVWGVLLTLAVAALAITAMLLVRRKAPDGSYFNDGDRAAGVFGVLATGFSILLGFIVFLAFTSYDAVTHGRRDRGTHGRTAGRDGAVLSAGDVGRTDRRAGLLRPVGRQPTVGSHGSDMLGDRSQPVGRGAVPHDRKPSTRDRGGAVRV